MRILYAHYLPHTDQPAGHMIHAVAQELRGLGHEVTIHDSATQAHLVSGKSNVKKPSGLRSSRLRAKLWFARAIARDHARRWKEEAAIRDAQPDVILVRQDPYCVSMAAAGHRLGIPVVTYADAPAACEARQRNYSNRWHPPRLVEAIERSGLARSRAVVAITEPAAQALREYHLKVPVHVVPNGVNPLLYPRISDAEQGLARAAIGLTAPCVVGFQGTFQQFHGMDLLRDLMLSTVGQPNVQWLLIGDGPEREPLERSLAGRVKALFLGRKPSEQVGRLLGLVDIAVAPYCPVQGPFYGCPLKVLEYAAAGCATLASDLGDIRPLLDNGRVGVVLPADEPAAWISALASLLENPLTYKRLGQEAREWALSNLTWANTARRIADILSVVADKFEPRQVTTLSEIWTDRGSELSSVPDLYSSGGLRS